MPRRIVFTPEARDQLDQLHHFLATAAGDAGVAFRFVDGILDHVATLADFPERGTPRDDIRSGLRTVPWRRRVTIAYVVETHDVVIAGVFYAGRDFESLLRDE